MSRDFNGSSMYLNQTPAPISAWPMSMAAWFYPDGANAYGQIFTVCETIGGSFADLCALGYQGNAAGDPLYHALKVNGGNKTALISTGSCNNNAWNHVMLSGADANNRTLYLNGAEDGSVTGGADANFVGDGGGRNVSVGVLTRSTPVDYFDGKVAEVAIWSAALTLPEAVLLNKGYSPLLVRPSALVFYAPLIGRNSPEIEIVGANALSLTNSPATFTHPPIIYPHKQPVIRAGSGAAVASTARSFSVVIA